MRKFNVFLIVIISIILSSCGGETNKNTTSTNNMQDITHNGVTYGTIESPTTGKIWLDRNLGAAEVCTSKGPTNSDSCEGDFYQWGRNVDGHEDSLSATRTTKINGLESSDGKFVIGHADWSTSTQRGANWSKTDGSSVCPVGFRVPTFDELVAEGNLDDDNYSNHLKYVFSYFSTSRDIDGILHSSNDNFEAGGYWSSTVSSANKAYVWHYSYNPREYKDEEFRAMGFYVRCIKP